MQGDDGRWRMFYTGVSREGKGLVQRIGSVVSSDLFTWSRPDGQVVVQPDRAWYESLDDGQWPDEAWRDPWVYRDPTGGWRMLVTARANHGAADSRGVVGAAHSDDLERWTVEPPLSTPGSGFGQLEVLQLAEVDGRGVLVFSCLGTELSTERKARGDRGGIWAVNVDELDGPFDVSQAYRLADETLYVGRLVQHRDGGWRMLAFRNTTLDGDWIGEITDPMPLEWVDGRLRLPTAESGLTAQGEYVSAGSSA